MAAGVVYIGGFQPTPDTLFIKVGKTIGLKQRVLAYRTHLPGGLTFLHAARAAMPGRAEAELLSAVAAIDGVTAVGGEWFRCEPLLRNTVIDELYRVGTGGYQVHVGRARPFGEQTPGRRSRRARRAATNGR